MWNYIIPAYLANPKLWYINRRWQRLDYIRDRQSYDARRSYRERHPHEASYIRSMKDAGRGHLL